MSWVLQVHFKMRLGIGIQGHFKINEGDCVEDDVNGHVLDDVEGVNKKKKKKGIQKMSHWNKCLISPRRDQFRWVSALEELLSKLETVSD